MNTPQLLSKPSLRWARLRRKGRDRSGFRYHAAPHPRDLRPARRPRCRIRPQWCPCDTLSMLSRIHDVERAAPGRTTAEPGAFLLRGDSARDLPRAASAPGGRAARSTALPSATIRWPCPMLRVTAPSPLNRIRENGRLNTAW